MAGDEDQRERRFCRLYEANFRPVQAYAVNRLARPDDVADVVAEVFMVAWRRLADVPPPPHDRFWLYGTARRVIAKRYRSASRRRSLLGRLAAEQRPQAAEWAEDSARERLLAAILDGPDSPAAVSLYRQIIAQPPAAARARRRYRLAVPVIAGACAIVALALTFIYAPARHDGTAAAVLGQAALTAARQPAATVPGPGQYVYVETIEGQRDGAGICVQTVRVWAAPDGSGREVASAPTGPFCHGGIPSQTFRKGQGIGVTMYPGAADLPTDPARLEQFIVRHFEGSAREDVAATFDFAGTFLQAGAPPQVRAALFRLIQSLPGIECARPDDRQARAPWHRRGLHRIRRAGRAHLRPGDHGGPRAGRDRGRPRADRHAARRGQVQRGRGDQLHRLQGLGRGELHRSRARRYSRMSIACASRSRST